MDRTFLVFFAMPDEQLRWLQEFLAGEDIWCVLKTLPPNRRIEQVSNTESLATLPLRSSAEIGGLQLFFGRRDLVPAPIWRTVENGDCDIDFTRSQAIQYDPATVIDERVLLSGQMAIMRQMYYEEAGIDSKPLMMWFRQIAKSFIKLKATGTVFLRDSERGEEKVYPDIVATRGAVEWQRSGHLLKQFLKGAYEFHVSAPT